MFKAIKAITNLSLLLFLAACGGGGGSDNPHSTKSGTTGNDTSADVSDVPPDNSMQVTYELFAIAGQATNSGTADGQASSARFLSIPYSEMGSGGRPFKSMAIDGAGNLYMNDAGAIRRISPAGQVTTLAGLQNHYGNSNARGADARFQRHAPIAADDEGNVYVGDVNSIRKVSPDGTVETMASFESMTPHALAIDRNRNLYLTGGASIIRLAPDGTYRTLVTYPRNDSWGYYGITNLFVDPDGNVYYRIVFHALRQISGGVAPSPIQKISADGTQGTDPIPTTLAHIDRSGNLYFYEARRLPSAFPIRTDHYLMKRAPDGMISTVALVSQSYETGWPNPENRIPAVDPNGALAFPGLTPLVAADAQGNVYYAGEGYIGKVDRNGAASVHAGVLPPSGNTDGNRTDARFETTYGIARGPNGSLYVNTSSGIRRIDAAGNVTTILSDRTLQHGPFTADASGNVYVMDGSALVRISPAGVRTTIAGARTGSETVDGVGSAARLGVIMAIAVGPDGNIYLLPRFSINIRRVTPEGMVTTMPLGLGVQEKARIDGFRDLEIDQAGNFYFVHQVEACTYALAKITPTGDFSTLAALEQPDDSNGCQGYASNVGLAIDAEGDLYVLNTDSNLIHKVKQDGSVTRIAGQTHQGFRIPQLAGELFHTYDIEVVAPNTLAISGGYGIVGLKSPAIGTPPQ